LIFTPAREDEERSETRYVMRIAGTSEPSNLRTHPALSAPPRARPSECRPQVPLIPFLSFFIERKKGEQFWVFAANLS